MPIEWKPIVLTLLSPSGETLLKVESTMSIESMESIFSIVLPTLQEQFPDAARFTVDVAL